MAMDEPLTSSGARTLGGRKTLPFIIASTVGVGVGGFAMAANLGVYLIDEYNFEAVNSTLFANIVNGFTSFAPFVAATVFDTCLAVGYFAVITAACVATTLMLNRLLGKGKGKASDSGSRGRGSYTDSIPHDIPRHSVSGMHAHGSGSGAGTAAHDIPRRSFSGTAAHGSAYYARGDHWGTSGSEEVQPETAERLQETQQFQADDPATSISGGLAYYREYTEDVATIALPYSASRTRAMCDKHHPIAFQRYRQLSDDIRRRVRDAREQIARRKGNAIFEKTGRGGNKAITKRPPPGRRIILQWSDNPRVPIGEWATRFNNMIGCLVRRADFINPYFRFNQQPFKSYEEIWRELMKSYCLEDHPYSWDYLFGSTGKVLSQLRSWRFELKAEYYNKITEDWERFWKLDSRVDTHHFGALLILWDDPNTAENSEKAKANRAAMEIDHFMGSQSFAQREHKYKKSTEKPTMPVNLLIAEGYTPKPGYDKMSKKEKIKKLQEEVDAQLAQALQESQEFGGVWT